MSDKILIIGAGGQIGVELTLALRSIYGNSNVIATDVKAISRPEFEAGPFQILDILDKNALHLIIQKEKITQIYLLAAILSATGEKDPLWAWNINMTALLNTLEACKTFNIKKLYWPSSIGIFGATTPQINTPQKTIIEPTTVYGISKYSGELWCQYFYDKYNLDVRSVRYPGIISWKSAPGGGTTDYAIDIYFQAIQNQKYTCFLSEHTYLPMMYMEDAIRGTLELMETSADNLSTRMAYNLSGISFSPLEIAQSIKNHIPEFEIDYKPDYRQEIANSWPDSFDGSLAQKDWGWNPKFQLEDITDAMLTNIQKKLLETASFD